MEIKKMTKRYNKDSVEFHNESYRPSYPAVNVKVYSFPSAYQIIEKTPYLKDLEDQDEAEKLAEHASEIAFETACELFWNEYAQEIANEHFPEHVKVYSQGRSNGWLIVDGLKDFSEWNAIDLRRWQGFENAIKAEVKYRTSLESIVDDITANQWYLPYAQQFNFYTDDNGQDHCIAIEKAALAEVYPFIR